ncbi:hypothetical protein [Chromobacterium vaccinii]|uniref:hypothetical protein n=1 Tax=Chromobacterium piscinae TaxID=686831 RepID=UPI001C8BC3E5|nr:hypothetical protein [Chromobacterium vaccinii]MBX9358035.1 hypothetical protein [Chromobacterium vaccinii]
MNKLMLSATLLAALAAGGAWAQSADEQLLAAQMAFQQAQTQQRQLDGRLKTAQDEKAVAEQRLAGAQAALDKANAELAAATDAQSRGKQALDQATQTLNQAWQRKEGGQ